VEIFALHGPSGTGKSTSALALAHKYHIPAIIDDGLLIFQGRKVAGYSAKYEKTTIQAVKRAIFHSTDHAKQVKEAILHNNIHKLLIIGTSEKMIQRIVDALQLMQPKLMIPITEIRSSAEIKAALFDREVGGRHVIPIPRMQVEQDLVKKMIAKVEKIFTAKRVQIGETTIVHPHFGLGRVQVSEKALRKLVLHSCDGLTHIREISKIKADITALPIIDMELELQISLGDCIHDIVETIQSNIYKAFFEILNLEIEKIRVHVLHIQITS
jgi:adenylate kinase family enzyme/uncharacterized alkaline shock family protein YloU